MQRHTDHQAPAYMVDEQVRRAIQERVGVVGDAFVEAGYGFIKTVAGNLGFPQEFGNKSQDRDWDRLCGQVKRALDKLADDPSVQLVIRVKPSERGPDGTKPRWTRYYIPEAYAKLASERSEKQRKYAETRARWDRVTADLTSVLGPIQTDHLGRPVLTLKEWDEILESVVDR